MEQSLYEFEFCKQFFCHYMNIFSKQIIGRKFMLEKSLAFIIVRGDIIVWDCVYICDVLYDCTPCLNDVSGN